MQILPIREYQDRRERRFDVALALYGADVARAALLHDLRAAIAVAGGDRAAVVWVDEYGRGFVHPHAVLDLAFDVPRREFPSEPLAAAWVHGAPSVCDVPDRGRPSHALQRGAARSVYAVALGSDGLRTWFFVVDGIAPREPLRGRAAERIAFLAGRCTGMVLHNDMDSPADVVLTPEGGSDRFAAWPILKDIDGREDDEEARHRIALRFIVARMIRAAVDAELQGSREDMELQVEGVRKELGGSFGGDVERGLWEEVLAAVSSWDGRRLSSAVLDLAERVEELEHLRGARELYRSAYQAAMLAGAQHEALEAAARAGRLCHRGADLDATLGWYRVAHSLAICLEDRRREAAILDRLAGVHCDRDEPGRAWEVLRQALDAALLSGDRDRVGAVFQSQMSVLAMLGRLSPAVRAHWRVVRTVEGDEAQLQALVRLADGFLRDGDPTSARNAYRVVAALSRDASRRRGALSRLAALESPTGEG